MRGESAFLSMRKFHVPVSVPLSHLKLNRYGLKLDHCVFQDRYLLFWLELSTTHLLALLRTINASWNISSITWSLSFATTLKVWFLFVVISTLRVRGLSQIVKVNTRDSGPLIGVWLTTRSLWIAPNNYLSWGLLTTILFWFTRPSPPRHLKTQK